MAGQNVLRKPVPLIPRPSGFKTPNLSAVLADIDENSIIATPEYLHILRLLRQKHPVIFVSRKAGMGKYTLIKYIRTQLAKNIVTVGPTGVAALNADSSPIHSFFRFPPISFSRKTSRYLKTVLCLNILIY